MSAQLICKVIRILETLISIILMNLNGGLLLFSSSLPASVKKGETQDLCTSGKYRGESRGFEGAAGRGGVVVGQFDIWSQWGHSVVMRRLRPDQSERVCPGAQLSLILRQAR